MSNEHSSKDNLNKGYQSSIVDHKEISKVPLEKMKLIIRHLVLLLVIVFAQLSNFLALESVWYERQKDLLRCRWERSYDHSVQTDQQVVDDEM